MAAYHRPVMPDSVPSALHSLAVRIWEIQRVGEAALAE